MRINVDDVALRDPAIQKRLARFAGLNRFDAFGRLIHVWGLAYDMRSAELLIEDVDGAADLIGFAAAMVRAELADEVSEDAIHVRGVDKRIGYLLKQAELGAKGGSKRAEQCARDGSRGAAGRFAKGAADTPPSEPLDTTKGRPSEPLEGDQGSPKPTSGSSPAPDHALAPDASASADRSEFALTGTRPVRTRKKPAPRPADETSLPDDWQPTTEHATRARASGLVLAREADLFRARCADKARRSANWNMAFTTWLIKAPDFRGGFPSTTPPPSPAQHQPRKLL